MLKSILLNDNYLQIAGNIVNNEKCIILGFKNIDI